jgi:DNA-binding NtrC family response regulator
MSTFSVPHPLRSQGPDGPLSVAGGRFHDLVASPLRAGLLRFLHARRDETFEIETLMAETGCMRGDAERCLEALVAAGVARRSVSGTPRYGAARPDDPVLCRLLSGVVARERTGDDPPSLARLRELVARDEKMLLVLESIRTAAKTDIAVLVLGPTGVGKEAAARAIHDLSRRRAEPFQPINCAAVPDTLFESEVFGHEKGAFTGAHERRIGRVELAHRGTLFLDEIGDLPMVSQAKLLRVLEERQVERLGGRGGVDVDFRLVSATNHPVDLLVAERRFREDLYYRVNAFTIRLPALKERREDIPALARLFLAKHCTAEGLPSDAHRFTEAALDRLTRHDWPGNIRELIATVSRAALSSDSPVIDLAHVAFLPPALAPDGPAGSGRIRTLAAVECDHIRAALGATRWNKKETARLLGISRETLYRKIRAYRLTHDPPDAPAGCGEGMTEHPWCT